MMFSKNLSKRENISFLKWAPGIVLVFIGLLIPLCGVFLFSLIGLSDRYTVSVLVGLHNYLDLIRDPGIYIYALGKSILMALGVCLACLPVAWVAAYLLVRLPRDPLPWVLLVAAPFCSGLILRITALQLLFAPGGSFYSDIMYSNVGTFVGLSYIWLPFMILAIYLSLSRFPFKLVDVARTNGASYFRTFLEVVLPMNATGTLIGCAVVILPVLASHITPAFLGGPDGDLYGNYLVRQIDSTTYPKAAAMSVILLLTSGMFLLAMRYVWKIAISSPNWLKGMYMGLGAQAHISVWKRNVWLNSPIIILVIIFYSFLYLPIVTLFFSSFSVNPAVLFPIETTLEWYESLYNNWGIYKRATVNSFWIGFWASTIALFIGFFAALDVRRSNYIPPVPALIFILPIMLSPIIIGIVQYLYFSKVGVTAGVMLAAVSNSIHLIGFSFLFCLIQLMVYNLKYEDVAKVHGAKFMLRLTGVTLPLVWPGLVGTWIICFLIAFNDNGITGYAVGAEPTLPTMIWGSLRYGLDGELWSLASLILFGVLLLIFIIYLLRSKVLSKQRWYTHA
uniref:ABC-type spermidine/putrescine transport system, permease component I n=1 Tax=Candidatus Kentrum sp. LFY TaxID=2126342 RepID=A0A450UBH8_9GAMM|nr:MAG: ABC-type spermidine/putrescine transport system, permease component I [Candidatus Kentron sp. LFY]